MKNIIYYKQYLQKMWRNASNKGGDPQSQVKLEILENWLRNDCNDGQEFSKEYQRLVSEVVEFKKESCQ